MMNLNYYIQGCLILTSHTGNTLGALIVAGALNRANTVWHSVGFVMFGLKYVAEVQNNLRSRLVFF